MLGDYEARWIQFDGSTSTLRSSGGVRYVTFDGGKTTLNVLGADGNAELTEDAQRILQVLADDLK